MQHRIYFKKIGTTMNYLHNYNVRRNIMSFLLLVVMIFGIYAAFADTIQGAIDIGTTNI